MESIEGWILLGRQVRPTVSPREGMGPREAGANNPRAYSGNQRALHPETVMQAPEPLRLRPALIERPWAGDRLRTVLHKNAPEGMMIGESWELSDHPSAPSSFQEGAFSTQTFGEVFRAHAADLFDISSRPPGPYPFLVKFIDARENLSIQVHPDDAHAPAPGSGGKSECWYVIDCKPGSHVLCGFHGEVSPDQLRKAAHSGDFDQILERRPIHPGTFVNVPAGTVHAILEGTLICEISQTSSEIARLWDWNRPPRKERRIDIETAVMYANFEPDTSKAPGDRPFDLETSELTGLMTLVQNRHFEVQLMSMKQGQGSRTVEFINAHGLALSVVQGDGAWSWTGGGTGRLGVGETWLLPAGLSTLTFDSGDNDLRLLLVSPQI